MQCPECQGALLKVNVTFAGEVACQFSEPQHFHILETVALQSEFDDEAGCRCMSCSWVGRVGETGRVPVGHRIRQSPATSMACAPLSPEELDAISEEIQSFGPVTKQIAERLVEEVLRLNSLLETVARLPRGSNGPDGDTWVG
ncbi:MAG: hypothetical protein ACE5KM_05595 [Planctomycetaceae bacterium]